MISAVICSINSYYYHKYFLCSILVQQLKKVYVTKSFCLFASNVWIIHNPPLPPPLHSAHNIHKM